MPLRLSHISRVPPLDLKPRRSRTTRRLLALAAFVTSIFLYDLGAPPASAISEKTIPSNQKGKSSPKVRSSTQSKKRPSTVYKTSTSKKKTSSVKTKPSTVSSSARARLAPKSTTLGELNPPRSTYQRLDQQPATPLRATQAQLDSLEVVSVRRTDTSVALLNIPQMQSVLFNRVAAVTPTNDYIFFTLDPALQDLTEKLVRTSSSPHVAVVVMNPLNGRILAMADKSPSVRNLALHADLPAASLFKVVTAAAAVEQASVSPYTTVNFRGGTYTLNQYNYRPDKKKDRRTMSVAEALGRSCNPVFGRIALRYLSPQVIQSYAEQFGFNEQIPFELPLPVSHASVPWDDYQLSRTAAGFGEVSLSPVHAAAFMSGIANEGILPRPYLVDRIVSPKGEVLYKAQPAALRRLVQPETASKLLQMMEYTTTIGTSRKEFVKKNRPVLGNIEVAAKTGTLSGDNPKGINNWFIAAAPMDRPEIAVAVLVVNPGGVSGRASHIGRQILQAYFQ